MREPKLQLNTAWRRILVLAIVFLSLSGRVSAQNFVPPVSSEKTLTTAPGVTKIETAMIDCPAFGGKLLAAVFDSAGWSVVKVWHSSGIGTCWTIVPTGATDASVAIIDATNFASGSRYWLLVSYIKGNEAYVHKYLLTSPGTKSFSYASRSAALVSKPGVIARNPRIEAFPDTSILILGVPSYPGFVVTWMEGDSLFCGSQREQRGAAPFTSIPVAKVQSGSNADVAGITDYTTNQNFAAIAYKDINGALSYTEVNVSASSPAPSTPVVITADPNTDNTPVIEAMNLYDPSLGGVKWQVAISKYDASCNKWKAYSYNNVTTTGENCIDPATVLGSTRRPVLAAGIGKLGGSFYIGNSSYIVGFKPEDTCNHYAQYVNGTTGRVTYTVNNRTVFDTTYTNHTVQLYDTTFIQDTVYVIDTNYVEVSVSTGKGNGNGNGNANGHSNNRGKGKAIGKIKKMNSSVDSVVVYIDTVSVNYIDTFSVAVRDSSYTTMSVGERTVVDTNRNFYQVNNEACGRGQRAFSVSTSENTGNGTFSAWYDGTCVKYKLIFNKAQFKPADGDNVEEQPIYKIMELAKPQIRVYPVPTQGYLNVEGAEGSQYVIADVTGRQLKNGIVDGQIDVKNLQTGVYIIRLSKEDGDIQSLRFIKE